MISFVSRLKIMARRKQYREEEVIEKAMNLFWRNGYETTSTRMLENEMGINQFSIYSSFGNKQGVLLESIKCYKGKLKGIVGKLKNSGNGLEAIKQYFYDFLEFSKGNEHPMGCLLANTANELGSHAGALINDEIGNFTRSLRNLFVDILKQDATKSPQTLEKQANYLIISITGLSLASKVYSKQQLADYIETTFERL